MQFALLSNDPARDQRTIRLRTIVEDVRDRFLRLGRVTAARAVRAMLRFYNRPEIVGRHHLPVGRSFVIVANHTSHLDTLCLQAAVPLEVVQQTYAAAAHDYFFDGGKLRAACARIFANAIPFVRQGPSVRACMARCRALLDDPYAGNILIVYPEGTRSPDGEIAEFKRGIGDLVAARNIPVVPCHIDGAYRAWPKHAWMPRPLRVRLTFGRPRTYAHLARSKHAAQAIAGDLRRAVIHLASATGSIRAQRVPSCAVNLCATFSHS